MFNKFIKKSSKFFAVLLTATLAFTPLSYGAGPATFADLGVAISDGSASPQVITLENNLQATETDESLGTQGASVLEISGSGEDNIVVDGNNQASGFAVGEGKNASVEKITFQNFYKEGEEDEDKGSVVNNSKGTLSIENSKFNSNVAESFGGAIRHKSKTSTVALTVTNSSFTANQAGIAGAVMIDGGYTSFENTLFKGNEAGAVGALAIAFSNEGDVSTLTGVEFDGNKSLGEEMGYAGALYLDSAVDVRITNNKFTNNQAVIDGGAISNKKLNSGEGSLSYANGALSITGSTFTGNKAGGNGGAIDNYFYGSSNDNSTDAVYVYGSSFEQNQATNGGAIYNHSAAEGDGTAPKMLIENTTFTGNSASEKGGAIYNEGTLTIKDSVFSENTAIGGSNDIYNTGTLTILGTTSMDGGITASFTASGEYTAGITTIGDGKIETVLNLTNDQAVLQQKTLNILAKAELSAYVGHINVADTIVNNGLITIKGDTVFANDLLNFTGTGRIVYTGNVIYNTDDEIDTSVEQSTVTVSADKTLTIGDGGTVTTNSIGGGADSGIEVEQGGKLVLNLNEESTFGVESLTGNGTFEINVDNIEESKTLDFTDKTISVSTIVATGDKHLVLSGGQINSDIINNTTGESLELTNTTINNDIYNYPGSPETTMGDGQPVIDINEGVTINGKITNSSGTINVWGESFSVLNTVTSTQTANIEYNVLNIGDADKYSVVTSSTAESVIEYQTINVVNGILTLQGASADALSGGIQNSSITVTTNGRFEANASTIEDTSIQNDGIVTFTGGTNNNVIDGEGVLKIEGIVENAAGTTITQSNIEIGNATGKKLTAFADDIKAAVTVFGDGTYDVTGGTISYRVVGGGETKGNVNIGTAEVKISSAIYKNNINISTSVIVDNESYLGDSSETASDLTINTGAKIDMKNDTVGTATINAITVNPSTEWTLLIDADLAAKTADNFVILDTENSSIGADSQATIDTVNFLTDFVEGQVDAKMQIANANINLQLADPLNIFKLYTTENSYDVSTINDETGSFLNVVLSGLGTLPQAIYDGADEYSATRDEDVTAWIDDVNTLSANLLIVGNNKTIKAAPESGVLEGINASTYTLTIEDLVGFEGFNNAISVDSDSEYTGTLNVSTVTFKNNTGDAVIKNAGNTSLKNVTFEGNEVNADVENTGDLLITGTEGVTTFEKGITGEGTTTITGTTVNFGNNAIFEQDTITIQEGSQVTVNAANVNVTGVDNTLYNSGSLVLYSTSTDTIDFASSIMDDISAGTTTIKTTVTDDGNIGANINMGDNDLQQYGLVIEEDSSLTVNANKLDIEDQVVNDGSVTFKSATAEAMVNKSTITTNGTGSLTIDGIVTNQEGTGISQANIYVLENGSFTASANDLTVSSEDGISNEGDLTFKSENDEQINENNIYGNGKFYVDGTLTNIAEVNQSSVTIGSSVESMVINEGTIRSTHVVVNEGSTLVAKGEIDTYGDGYFENGKITNNGTFVINVLNDEGEPDTVPNYNTIDGTGSLRISSTNFNVQENATISQSAVIIADVDSSLSVGVSSLTITNPDGAVQNAGKFVLTGEGDNFNKVEGYDNINGEIVFDEGSEINNYANINQSTVTVLGTVTNIAGTNITAAEGVVINGDGSLTTSASDINGQIENNKDLIFNAGTNSNVIVGTGTLTINGVVVNGNAESTLPMITVSQSSVTISGADSQLYNVGEITTNYLTGDGNLENQGKLILNLSEDAGYGLASLTGTVGVSSITVEAGKSVTLNNTGTIEQATIETYGDGTLVLTGNNIIANVVNYMTGNCLDIATRIVGTLDNNPANEETQGVVNILDGGSVSGLITNSTGTISIYTNFEVETGITSNNTSDITKNIINIGSATAAGVVISSQTIEYQTITISSGSLTMNSGDIDGTIQNSSITVEADGLLSVNPEKLVDLTTPITNDGIVEYYGGGVGLDYVLNTSTITASSEGILRINGNVQNDEGIGISKQNIEVLQTSTFTVNTNDMTDSIIKNAGEVLFFGLSEMTNETEVTGLTDDEGNTTYGTLSIESDLVNNAEIDQTDINVDANLTNNEEMNARGTFTNSLELDNTSAITAATFRNEETGTVTNETGATITASKKLFNLSDVDNSGDIVVENEEGTASLESVEGATITNNEGASISADTLINGSDDETEKSLIENKAGASIETGMIQNFAQIKSSGTITTTDITNEVGGEIENYGEVSEDGTYEGGIITASGKIDNLGTITSNASGIDALIENSGIYNVTGGTVTKSVTGNGGIVNIKQSSVTVSKEAYISENEINLEGTQLKLEDESNLRSSILNIGEDSTLDTRNGETNDMTIRNINVAEGITWNYNFDVDLELKQSDLLKGTAFGENSTMNIGIINVLADSDYTSSTDLEIADTFSNTDIQYASFATTQVSYTVEQLTGGDFDNATWIRIKGKGYGGLPQTVYDGIASYLVTGDEEGNDKVIKWVKDEDGVHDTLKADLVINALEEGKTLIASPEEPATSLTGLKTGKNTLKINNDGNAKELTIKGFENALTVNNADGRLEVNKVVFSSNTGTAVITNEGATTLNGVTFDNTNTADADVANNGDLLLSKSSSTFTKGIVGTGTTTIKGVGIDMGDATLQQARVEISDVEGSSLTARVANTEVALFMNNGELSLIGSEDEAVELSSEINGIGNTILQSSMTIKSAVSQKNIDISESANIIIDDNASVSASTITVNADATLTANADNIHTATNGKIANEGEIIFTGGTNNNIIIGEQGKIFIEMNKEVINSTGTQISQQFIEVREGGKFAMNADDVETATTGDLKGIQNNGDLEITGGTNKNIIGRGDAITGNVIISGLVINEENTEINQEAITVNEGASFTASASDLITDNGIGNAGELIFAGSDMENNNEIIGEGNLTVIGDLQNNKSITQTKIDVVNGTFEHNAGEDTTMAAITAANVSISTSATFIAHSEITVSDQITNDGTFKINVLKPEGGADEVSSQNNIIGKGNLIISSTVYTNDGGTISQKTITIDDEDSGFISDIQKVTTTDGIANSGEVTFIGNGTNKNVISGTGNLTIDGTIENSTGTAISQTAIAVTSGNGFKASANDVKTTDGIENDGTLTFTGGTNTNEITMLPDAEGVLVVEGDLTNQANIEQKTINITGGDFENVRTSSITAESITVVDGSSLITDAKDLAISDSITITGTKTVLNLKDEGEAEIGAAITGAGKIVKEGEGTVTLSGENAYTGTTTITGGAIRIVAENGISEEKIYMNGGKLITGENSEIALSNEIIGTDHNDVNIETEEGGNLILDGEIFGNKDLVKTGTGLLDLQMESNSYAGDTIISSGTVRGTTANINGTVTGSGAEDSAVEFYDADGEVTLNEIADMGTFDKTGAATMTVTNNFKAINANILSGTFIIDNDTEMGGSGSTFEVTGDMRVENTLLKGYGDITTGNLIIGQGATFAPGNSTTTFKVTGDLTFEEDGNYDVEFGQVSMDEAGHYNDNTTVSGTTTIGDNAKITLNNLEGKYYVPETIELINSGTLADGYEYQEDNVTFNDNDANDLRPGYDTRISTRVYTEGNTLKIDLQRKKSEYSDSLEFERSHNEQEAATAIDNISTGNPGDITNPLDAMEKMYYYQDTYDIDGLKAALNDIAGVIHANSTMLTFTNAKIEHVYDKVQERSKCLLPCDKVHDKIWAEYYYNTYSVDANENSPKFDTNVNGFLVGFDMISAKSLTLGIMAGYGTSELKQVKDKTTMNDINFGFYGGYETEKWLFKGMLLGGYEQYSTDRTIGFMDRMANSEYNGYSAALDLELGYKISLNKKDSQAKHKMYLKPYLGVTGSYMMNEGFEEKNAESLNLKVEDYNAMTAQARAGIGINGKIKKFGWYAKAGVRHYLTEDYNEIESSLLDYKDQTAMKIRSAEMGKLSYGGGLGADFALSTAWTVFANGLASFADNSTNYYGNIGLMYKFGCVNNEKKTDEDVEKISAVLNDKITEDEMLKRDLKNKEKELAQKEKELADAKAREKELQDRIQKYEANIVSAEQAQQMKEKTIKTYRLGEKPTFVFGTDKLNKSGKASLKQVATELEGYPDAEVLVEGHTDNVGGDEINQKISEQRASSVATTLKKDYGVKNNISVIGKGKTEPIASNDTAEGRAKNRRVEIIVTTAE